MRFAPFILCCLALTACHQKGPTPLEIPKFSPQDGRGYAQVLVNEPASYDHSRYDRMVVYGKKITEADYHDMGSGTLLFEPGIAYDIGVKLYKGTTLVAMTRESDPACPVLRQERFFVGANRPLDVEVCDQSPPTSAESATPFSFPTTSPDVLLRGASSAGAQKPAPGQTLAL